MEEKGNKNGKIEEEMENVKISNDGVKINILWKVEIMWIRGDRQQVKGAAHPRRQFPREGGEFIY